MAYKAIALIVALFPICVSTVSAQTCYMFEYDRPGSGHCVVDANVTVYYSPSSPCAMSLSAMWGGNASGCCVNLHMACDHTDICPPPSGATGDTDYDCASGTIFLLGAIYCNCTEFAGIVAEARIYYSKVNVYANCPCVGSCNAYDWYVQGICD